MKFRLCVLAVVAGCGVAAGQCRGSDEIPDPGCESYQAWQGQSNVRSDSLGIRNIAFPEGTATYWGTIFDKPLGTVVVVKGRYPKARYIALQMYDDQQNVVAAINDQDIVPDAGQNNPFRTGYDQGTYTVQIVFGLAPRRPPANTIYTGGLTKVKLLYRIYHSNFTDDLTGATYDPVLPVLSIAGQALSTCPPRPIIVPEDATVWGRLDNTDRVGVDPSGTQKLVATNPPSWSLVVTSKTTQFYPSADNSYMNALISREFLAPPYSKDIVVMRMMAPTFPNTQAGEPPYLATTDRQVRFWSVCQYDPYTTSVNRCIADDQVAIVGGYATVVISDPSKKPSDATLAKYGAKWMNWGALQPGDFLYDIDLHTWGTDQPVYYYGYVMYRQTLPNPAWTQSMTYVSNNYIRSRWQSAMGTYWPVIGYCKSADFEAAGAGCLGR